MGLMWEGHGCKFMAMNKADGKQYALIPFPQPDGIPTLNEHSPAPLEKTLVLDPNHMDTAEQEGNAENPTERTLVLEWGSEEKQMTWFTGLDCFIGR